VIKERFLGGLESLERGWREDIWMTETPTTITPFFTVGSKWYLDMSFSSMSCTFSLKGSSISVFVWQISWEEHFWEKYTSGQSLLLTIGSGYNLGILVIQSLSKFWTVEIKNKNFEQKLCFLHSRSAIFRSVRLNPSFWKFHRWMKLIFGYVILIRMNYNCTIWIVLNTICLLFMIVWNCYQNWFYVNRNSPKIKRKLSIRET